MENIIKIIKKNQLFSGVSEENIKNISKDIKYYIKTYNKGEIIAHEDDECSFKWCCRNTKIVFKWKVYSVK